MYANILLSTDGSDVARKGVEHGVALAKAFNQLVIDTLKWGIEDAGRMSGLRRALLRQFAKADPEYDKPIPLEIDA